MGGGDEGGESAKGMKRRGEEKRRRTVTFLSVARGGSRAKKEV